MTVSDGAGNAGTYNITIHGGALSISGLASISIATDYGSVTMQFDGAQWLVQTSSSGQNAGGFVYPEDFGAVGDDPNHDDAPAIQQAVNYVSANDSILLFHTKTYYSLNATPIEVPSNTVLLMNGATLHIASVDGGECIGFRLTGASRVQISDGTVEGVLAATVPLSSYGVYITDISSQTTWMRRRRPKSCSASFALSVAGESTCAPKALS